MNKKGFTLIELIMVIVVIGIIAMIAIQAVSKRIVDSQNRAYDIQINNIKTAAKKYMLENSKLDEYHLNTLCVSLSMLQQKGYLEKGSINNPKTGEKFNLEQNYVEIIYDFNNEQYIYSFTQNCVSNIVNPASKKIVEDNNPIKINIKDDGLYETIDSYVFKGTKPNNYIKFKNNTNLWRIISIDKETMMMKIVNLDISSPIQITGDILKQLNDEFTTSNSYSSLKEYVNNNSKWNSGIVNSLNSGLSLKSIEKQSNIYNTIGLLTVGEYVDASLIKNCHVNNSCSSYLSNNKNNWLLNKSKDNKAWFINQNNQLLTSSQDSTKLYYAYPVLFLKANNVIDGGSGSETDPYILKQKS